MPKQGKKFREAKSAVPQGVRFSPTEAMGLVKQSAFAKFDETVEVATRLSVDPRQADQVVRGTVILPHGTGKTKRVLVIAEGDKAQEAQAAGADFVGVEFLEKIKGGWLDFDKAIATPDMMAKIAPIAKVLGPRGLMPNPKVGTVTKDVAKAVKEQKAGSIEFRVEKAGIVHAPIGKLSFGAAQLLENLNAVLDQVVKAKPQAAKGTYLQSITLTSTMGPGIKLDPSKVASAAV
jgi:large subunit ribosomal protein L1